MWPRIMTDELWLQSDLNWRQVDVHKHYIATDVGDVRWV